MDYVNGIPALAHDDAVADVPFYTDELRDALLVGTGWVSVATETGFSPHSGFEPQVRRIGSVVYFRGGWSNTGLNASTSNITVGTIPVGFRPPVNQYHMAVGSNASVFGRMGFTSAGAVQISTGTNLAPYYLANESWPLD